MQHARIPTTHVGSLPRPQQVIEVLTIHDLHGTIDARFEEVVRRAVAEVVDAQLEIGIDFVSDGEMGKITYATYPRHRLSGFEEIDVPRLAPPADLEAFPDYTSRLLQDPSFPVLRYSVCRGPIRFERPEMVQRELDRLRSALIGRESVTAFLTAPSPGTIALFLDNDYYRTEDAYLDALAEAMRYEYEAIVDAGFFLQVDCPDIALGRHTAYRNMSHAKFMRQVERNLVVLNDALARVPAERLRLHLCWGNYEGPHTFDVPLKQIVTAVLNAKPSTLLFEAANPRHDHEWTVWRDVPLPDDKILAPGVIDSTTNFVEHPELVADRLCRFANIVGPERIIAATDCGFGTFAGFGAVDREICYEKLKSLTAGAALASRRLS
jgi:5-methyltetrahydropteroyltriglutamate--homocysteine methyltransferase